MRHVFGQEFPGRDFCFEASNFLLWRKGESEAYETVVEPGVTSFESDGHGDFVALEHEAVCAEVVEVLVLERCKGIEVQCLCFGE